MKCHHKGLAKAVIESALRNTHCETFLGKVYGHQRQRWIPKKLYPEYMPGLINTDVIEIVRDTGSLSWNIMVAQLQGR